MDLNTCDLSDRHAEHVQILGVQWRDFGARRQFSGPAVTIKCFEDNSRIKEVLATPGDGRVLVIDAGASTRCAVLGDMIATDAIVNAWAGIVVYGCVRDTAVLGQLDIGIKALGSMPRRSTRRGEGSINIPVEIGSAKISVGDLIVADEDGVIAFAANEWKNLVQQH